jgi:hypothetical protein
MTSGFDSKQPPGWYPDAEGEDHYWSGLAWIEAERFQILDKRHSSLVTPEATDQVTRAAVKPPSQKFSSGRIRRPGWLATARNRRDVDSLSADAEEYGRQFGQSYREIWQSEAALSGMVGERGNEFIRALPATGPNSMTARHQANSVVFMMGAVLFFLNVMIDNKPSLEVALQIVIILFALNSLTWAFMLLFTAKASIDNGATNSILLRKFSVEAIQQIEARRTQARASGPSASGSFSGSEMPSACPQGVSHQDAEELCAQWLRFFGEYDATTTRFTADGGIDVVSANYIAQVKNYKGTVGVAAVRELVGVAADDGRKAVFFTSGTFAAGAIEFANRNGVRLVEYDAYSGSVTPVNALATAFMNS